MSSLLRIVRFTRSLWPLYIAIIACSVLAAAATLVVPFLIGHATDIVAEAVSGREDASTAATRIIWTAVWILIAFQASTILQNVGGWYGDVMANRMRTILSVRYYDKLLNLPQAWFDAELTGTIVARLNRSITQVADFAKTFSNMFATMLLTTIAVLAISGYYAWPLAVLLLIVFPVYVWLTALTSKKWQRLEGEKNHEIDVASGRFSEVVGQIRVVKSFAREQSELDAFATRFGATDATTRAQSTHWHTMDVIRRSALNVIFFGIYVIIFLETVHGNFTVGTMVLLIQLMNMARTPVETMSYLIDTAQRAIAGSKDYFTVMDTALDPRSSHADAVTTGGAAAVARGARGDRGPGTGGSRKAGAEGGRGPGVERDREPGARRGHAPEAGTDAPGPRPVSGPEAAHSGLAPLPGSHSVEFDRVFFAYDEGHDVLQNISFTIDRGEKVAFVGESGGGKSTIVNLLLGLYQARAGRVLVGGHNVDDLPVHELRSRVGVVFQDASLFSGTIRENIAYGRPNATDQEVRAAAKRANADTFIERFGNGYDTVVGERGLKLSGGQKQRIAVARAILKDAPILVLDEATSALDTKSEREVQAGLEELMADRTSLIIAHRLSTIANVERIVTLKGGVIDEIGTPDELASSGGIYAELLALQNAGARKQLERFGITG